MKKALFTVGILLLICIAALAQQMPPIPIDSKVRIGHLDNGLTYYIRHNEEPKGQANFYIAQKVGSILEEENQRGLAHFLEHMCFNGTQKFPGNGVIKYCESIGVKFSADLNAYTSIDETVYNIDNVPVETTPSAVDSCLWILHDWADGLLLTAEDIDHERGVIHEEWRSRNDATIRLYEKIMPEIYPNNRYGQRMPIGTIEVIDNFPYKAIRDYYEKWYRPDQQGIVVVGDINVDEVEAKIKDIFGTIAKPENPAERYYIQVADNREPIVSIAKDKEQQYALTYIFCKHEAVPAEQKSNMSYMVQMYTDQVMRLMLRQRLAEMSEKPDAPFIQANIYDGNFFFSKTKGAYTGIAVTKESEVLKGATSVYREMLRAAQHGFNESEYERAKAEVLSQLESAYNERDKVKSRNLCKEYVRHFIDNEPIAGPENEYMFGQQIIPSIPVALVNEYVKSLVSDSNLVIACMLPDKEGIIFPTEKEMADAFARIASERIAPYEDKVSNEPLITKMPKAGKVSKCKESLFGYKKLTLSNGATVYYKSTDFKADQIQMNAFSWGGVSLYNEKDAVNLKVVNELCDLGGVGNFSNTDLSKALSGKKANTSTLIKTYHEGVTGNTTPKDLETMMQLVYLTFTAPRVDKDAFESWKSKQIAMLQNTASDPMSALSDTISKELFPNVIRTKSLKLEEVNQVDYNRVMQITKERFANAADFNFVFTGNINESSFIPMVEKYIASLPAKGKKESYKDFGASMRKGMHDNIFTREMENPTATIFIDMNGVALYDLRNKLTHSITDQILNIIMTEEIREKEGGTYGVSVGTQLSAIPQPHAMFHIYYQTDPDKYKHLNARIDEILEEFAKEGPSAKNMAKVKEYLIKKHNENLRDNGYYERTMTEYLKYGVDLNTNYEKILDSITADDVRATLANLLKQKNIIKIVMSGTQKK